MKDSFEELPTLDLKITLQQPFRMKMEESMTEMIKACVHNEYQNEK